MDRLNGNSHLCSYLNAMDSTAMEEEVEVGGTVEEICGELCVVSADVNHERRYLWCPGDRFFYSGQPCRGTMDNILELFMHVDLLLKSELGDYIVLAAWVGEKPEIIQVDNKLRNPVYGKQGNLCRSPKDGSVVVVALEEDFCALIRKEVIYLDGFPLDNGTEDVMGQIVSFDAVPLIQKDISGAIYAATCVWLGESAPRVVDRFQLHVRGEDVRVKVEIVDSDDEAVSLESPPKVPVTIALEDSETDDDIQIIEVIIKNDSVSPWLKVQENPKERASLFEKFAVGTVCVIPSEVLAFVNVCIDDVDVKVMLFRHSFGNCYNIRDVLSIGDRLCLLLRSASLFHSGVTWIVVKACKGNSDPKRLAEMMLPVENGTPVGTGRAVEESLTGSPAGCVPAKESTSGLPVQRLPIGKTTPGSCVQRVPVEETAPGLPAVQCVPVIETTPELPVESVVQQSSLVVPAVIGIVETVVRETALEVPMEIEDDVREAVPVKVDTPQRVAEPAITQNGAPPVVIKREVSVGRELPVVKGTETLKPIVLKPIPKRSLTQNVVLNGTGRLVRHANFFVAEMQSLPVKVLLREHLFYVNGNLCPMACHRHLGGEVSFDAVKLKKSQHSSGATHRAVLNWKGVKPTAQTVLKQTKLNPINGKVPFLPNTVYVGLVMDVPLLDCCVVKFGALPVLVQSKSLLVDPCTKDTSPVLISDYLKFGDHVALTCKVADHCVVAEVCGALPSFDSLFGAVGIFDKKSLSLTKNDVNVSLSHVENQLIDILRCTPMYLELNEVYKGIIVDFPYRNYGIAAVGEIRVLVHINSLVDVQGCKDDVSNISELLNLGSTVLLWIERKTVRCNSYYYAREARLIHDNISKNKVVLKNYRGVLQNVEVNQSTVKVCGGWIKANIHAYRLDPLRLERLSGNYVSLIAWKLSRLFVPVTVNVTLNDENNVVHSVVL